MLCYNSWTVPIVIKRVFTALIPINLFFLPRQAKSQNFFWIWQNEAKTTLDIIAENCKTLFI